MKQKTDKTLAKRIKVTSKKKLLRGHAYSSHKKSKKSAARLRRQEEPALVAKGFEKTVKRGLGI